MDDFHFPDMTRELRAYLDYRPQGEEGYAELKRLRSLIQPGLLLSYFKGHKDSFFAPAHEKVGSLRESQSPNGNYLLGVTQFDTKPGSWTYAQGKVFRRGSVEPVAVVNRNYGAFPFLFIEPHPNGHDYLVCGEDYQGQTVIELDSGKRRDFLPPAAEEGLGFCWAEYRFDTATSILIVCGCFWACPYEFRFFDFSNPMQGWPEITPEEPVHEDLKWPEVRSEVGSESG